MYWHCLILLAITIAKITGKSSNFEENAGNHGDSNSIDTIVEIEDIDPVKIPNENYNDDIIQILSDSEFDEIVPKEVESSEVTYYLFTRENQYNLTSINEKNLQVLQSGGKIKDIFFLVHGWTESRQKQWYEDLKNALLERVDADVIEVDWSGPASQSYPVSVVNSKPVGEIIGDFIISINQQLNVSLQHFTVIGHSLGGQVVGFVGKRIIQVLNKKLGNIIALDPAGPLYVTGLIVGHLEPSDAEMVEVIHTDGLKFGYAAPCGTIDFFPNGGTAPQPGCLNISSIQNITNISKNIFCSHHKSYHYFISAVKNGGFVATQCKSWLSYQLGLCKNNEQASFFSEANRNKTGNFFLQTTAKYPYTM